MTAHSPLPWESLTDTWCDYGDNAAHDYSIAIRDADGDVIGRADGDELVIAQERAMTIVRAVNCHDELVDIIGKLCAEMACATNLVGQLMYPKIRKAYQQKVCSLIKTSRAALAKAEGRA